MTSSYKFIFCLIVISILQTNLLICQTVKVTSNKAHIYIKPNINTFAPIQVKRGELFKKSENYNAEWVGIQLFSGKTRYIKSSKVEIIYEQDNNLLITSDLSKICEKIKGYQLKAENQAKDKYPNNFENRLVYEKFLFDKFVLNIFRKNAISSNNNKILLSCVNDSIIGPIKY